MEDSNIEWCHHTFSGWRSCSKDSAGCLNCYAEKMSFRNPAVLGVWGPKGTRPIASESMWKQPLRWNKKAIEAEERHRVFTASLSDVFEGADTMPEELELPIREARLRLLGLIRETPALDWLVLTKRPQNIIPQLEDCRYLAFESEQTELEEWLNQWLKGNAPENVWLGTSVENQKAADKRIPHLLKVPAKVHFLSCEPLLGPVDLQGHLRLSNCYEERRQPDGTWQEVEGTRHYKRNEWSLAEAGIPEPKGIDWVIVGGESGSNERVMHPDWARSLRDQCQAAGVAYLFKQWGEWREPLEGEAYNTARGRAGNPPAFIVDERHGTVHCFQFDDIENGKVMVRVGKKAAGRLLDGREWNEFPRGKHEVQAP